MEIPSFGRGNKANDKWQNIKGQLSRELTKINTSVTGAST
jgi:hypothetical protein